MTLASPATIGLRLRQLRTERGCTGRWLALRINVSPVTYSCWEKGKRVPQLEYAMRLADLYGVSVEALFGESEQS